MPKEGIAPVARRKMRLFYFAMTFNVFICVLVGVSWRSGPESKILIPSRGFWHLHKLSDSFWNREQRRLDLLHSPIFNPGLLRGELGDPPNPCEPDHGVRVQVADFYALPQGLQDFLLYMRCRSYPMVIRQPRLCKDAPFLLLVIKSLAQHFDRRQAIRQTWGGAGPVADGTVATVFLLGNAKPEDDHPDLLRMLEHEGELHGDLLLWDYRENFFNLTLKEVLFLEWFARECPRARFVLKGDDDVFVNTPRILDLLRSLPDQNATDLFIGDVITDAGPHRDKKLKYFIPESVFVGAYPPYAGGGGYLLSGDLALRLHAVSRQVALYPIDDVYTGMCLQRLGLAPRKHPGFRTFDIDGKSRRNPCIYRSLMLVHGCSPQEMLKIWPWVVDLELGCQ